MPYSICWMLQNLLCRLPAALTNVRRVALVFCALLLILVSASGVSAQTVDSEAYVKRAKAAIARFIANRRFEPVLRNIDEENSQRSLFLLDLIRRNKFDVIPPLERSDDNIGGLRDFQRIKKQCSDLDLDQSLIGGTPARATMNFVFYKLPDTQAPSRSGTLYVFKAEDYTGLYDKNYTGQKSLYADGFFLGFEWPGCRPVFGMGISKGFREGGPQNTPVPNDYLSEILRIDGRYFSLNTYRISSTIPGDRSSYTIRLNDLGRDGRSDRPQPYMLRMKQ